MKNIGKYMRDVLKTSERKYFLSKTYKAEINKKNSFKGRNS